MGRCGATRPDGGVAAGLRELREDSLAGFRRQLDAENVWAALIGGQRPEAESIFRGYPTSVHGVALSEPSLDTMQLSSCA